MSNDDRRAVIRIRRAALLYRHILMSKGYRPRRADSASIRPVLRSDAYAHALWMLNRLIKLLDEGKLEQASRWLGFAQGVFWQHGLFTVDEMYKHNTIDAELPPCCYVCHYEHRNRCQLFDVPVERLVASDTCPPSFCPLRSENA